MDESAAMQLRRAALLHTRAEIGREINTLVPIACLPDELLAEVFAFWVAQSQHDAPSTDSAEELDLLWEDIYPSYAWIRIAHVCHHWRTVALQTPRLWSTFMIDTEELAVELLARSKQAPLHLEIHNTSQVDILWDPLQEQMHHVESMTVVNYASTTVPSHYDCMRAAPELRRLHIAVDDDSVGFHWHAASEDDYYSTPFDNVHVPCLTTLHFKNTPVSWLSPLFKTSLTHLLFTLPCPWPNLRNQDIVNVLQALKQMPQLQWLVLANTLPDTPDSNSRVYAHLHETFPSLSYLKLIGSTSAIWCLLKHMSFPATTRLTLTCTDDHREQLELLVPLIAEKLRGTSQPGQSPGPFLSASSTDRRFCAWRQDLNIATPATLANDLPGSPKPDVELAVNNGSTHPAQDGNMFLAVCGAFPLREARTLYVGSGSHRTAPQRIALVATLKLCMPKVHSLAMGQSLASNVLPILLLTGVGRGQELVEPVFPELDTIVLHALQIPDSEGHRIGSFRHGLKGRRAEGYGVRRVLFRECRGKVVLQLRESLEKDGIVEVDTDLTETLQRRRFGLNLDNDFLDIEISSADED
ncbi:hypothetical protein PsYK624_164740 [Phanerochaete sordida]|uniref:F-box domain-containing protein n=1 Tax=Phanerochaete sordida TaxID=48140 RepID=A0A9P3GSC3_9APHY|nr:hypothetical protein PsYK624_164740 [Phanerochaete sordida]